MLQTLLQNSIVLQKSLTCLEARGFFQFLFYQLLIMLFSRVLQSLVSACLDMPLIPSPLLLSVLPYPTPTSLHVALGWMHLPCFTTSACIECTQSQWHYHTMSRPCENCVCKLKHKIRVSFPPPLRCVLQQHKLSVSFACNICEDHIAKYIYQSVLNVSGA